jgi:hypothetical protein
MTASYRIRPALQAAAMPLFILYRTVIDVVPGKTKENS